jgi:hypothetical protein
MFRAGNDAEALSLFHQVCALDGAPRALAQVAEPRVHELAPVPTRRGGTYWIVMSSYQMVPENGRGTGALAWYDEAVMLNELAVLENPL